MKRPEKTAEQTRRANRSNVPGVLGMEEMRMLTAETRPHKFVPFQYRVGGFTVPNSLCALCNKSTEHDLHQDYQP